MLKTQIKCNNRVCFAVLNTNNFAKIVRRVKQDEEKNHILMIQQIPKFQDYSNYQIKKLLMNTQFK